MAIRFSLRGFPSSSSPARHSSSQTPCFVSRPGPLAHLEFRALAVDGTYQRGSLGFQGLQGRFQRALLDFFFKVIVHGFFPVKTKKPVPLEDGLD